jgi:uncharacterized membrane protein
MGANFTGKVLCLEAKLTDVKRVPMPRRKLTMVALALALSVIVLAIQLPPAALLGKADVVGYAICHRIPERSFFLNGRQLPLCARCTGTFLGAIVGLVAMFLYGRRRASSLPPVPVLGMMIVFTGIWGFDGLNSYMTFFPGAPHLYEPRNWLRLTTGLLNGITLMGLVYPIFNFTVWAEPSRERVFKNVWELLALVPVWVLIILALQAGLDFLLYPLALLSSLGVVVMLTLLNALIATLVLGREGFAETRRQVLIPLVVGAALAIVEMTALVLVRAYLTTSLGLPI